jgi:hypothetical protein
MQVGSWAIELDPEATREAYASLPSGTGCTCDNCRNFDAAAGRTFPPEFLALAASMGIDPTKPAELIHWGLESEGLRLTGGWFHFVGSIATGADAEEAGTGVMHYQPLAPGIDVEMSRQIGLLPATFQNLAVVQLEFQTRVPWVLTDVEPAD